MLVRFIYEHLLGTDLLFVNYIEKNLVLLANIQKSDPKYKKLIDPGCISINLNQLRELVFEMIVIGKFETRSNIDKI